MDRMDAQRKSEIDKLVVQAGGDHDALARLYTLLRKDIFALAYSILGNSDAAEDVLSETFVRVWKGLSFTPRGDGSGKAFLLKVARNISMEMLREAGRTDSLDDPDCAGSPDAAVTDKDVTEEMYLDFLMRCLREEECKIILLYYYSQLTFKEIAHVLSIPVSTAKWRHDKALSKLRRFAMEEEKEIGLR